MQVNVFIGREAPGKFYLFGCIMHETFRHSRSSRKFFYENSWKNMNPHIFYSSNQPVINWKSESEKNMPCTISRRNKRILSVLLEEIHPIRTQVNVFQTKKGDVLWGSLLQGPNTNPVSKFWGYSRLQGEIHYMFYVCLYFQYVVLSLITWKSFRLQTIKDYQESCEFGKGFHRELFLNEIKHENRDTKSFPFTRFFVMSFQLFVFLIKTKFSLFQQVSEGLTPTVLSK